MLYVTDYVFFWQKKGQLAPLKNKQPRWAISTHLCRQCLLHLKCVLNITCERHLKRLTGTRACPGLCKNKPYLLCLERERRVSIQMHSCIRFKLIAPILHCSHIRILCDRLRISLRSSSYAPQTLPCTIAMCTILPSRKIGNRKKHFWSPLLISYVCKHRVNAE